MPKIPTFTAKGSIEQLAGTTSNIQMGLNNTLASALAPVTKAVVDFKVKENALQNQTEALRLGNDYTTDMLSVTKTIETATDNEGKPLYATNQEAANKYLKEQSDFYIKKYQALATNTAVKNKFTNSALSQTRKSIFQTDSYVSQQIVASLNNEYSKAKENLLITSRTDQSGIARGTLKDDLTKLALDTFRDQVSPVELNILIESIPAEIQMYDGLKDVREYPKRTYQLLKDKKYLPALSSDQREKIINQAEAILRPQLTAEYNNYLKYVADGKTPPKFDWELVQQVMPVKVAEQMMMNKTVTEGMVDDVKFLSTLPIVELDQTVSDLIKTAYDSYPFEVAQKKQKYLMDVVLKQKEELEINPAGFVLRTDQEAQDKAEELAAMESDGAAFTAPNQYDRSAIDQTQLEFVELLLDKQEKLGVKNKKVMTSNMSKQFVEEYLEAGKSSNKKKMNNMIDSLFTSYGKNESLALMQLSADGLPFGAEVYGVLKNSELAYIGLSFDTEAEKTAIKKELKVNDINFDDLEKEINEGIKPFLNIVAANTPFDSSESNPQTNKIRDFLTFVASQKLIGNPEMDQSQAVEYAVDKWNDNFVLADTYYVNKQQGDKTFGEKEIGKYNDKLDFIKNFLLDEMNIVSFKSNFETDPVKLSTKMYSQMLTNGEWRNAANGEGEVFGIVLDGSFAPVLNEKGEQITSIITDESNFIPGTNIVIDYDKPFENDPEDSVNNLITVYEQAAELARKEGITYEEALKKIEKPIIPNIKFDDGKKNSKISVDDQSSKTNFSIFTPVAASEIKQYKESKNVDFNFIEDREGFEIIGKVPDAKNSKSGITIASGFDLGARKLSDLNGLPKEIINKLKPFLNLKGNKAVSKAKELKITKEEGRIINQFAKKQAITRIRKLWKETTGKSFDTLTKEQATVVASVAFQYGNLKTATPNFWKYVTSNEWQKAYDELMDFKDRYPTRRKEEAKLLLKYLKTIK